MWGDEREKERKKVCEIRWNFNDNRKICVEQEKNFLLNFYIFFLLKNFVKIIKSYFCGRLATYKCGRVETYFETDVWWHIERSWLRFLQISSERCRNKRRCSYRIETRKTEYIEILSSLRRKFERRETLKYKQNSLNFNSYSVLSTPTTQRHKRELYYTQQ